MNVITSPEYMSMGIKCRAKLVYFASVIATESELFLSATTPCLLGLVDAAVFSTASGFLLFTCTGGLLALVGIDCLFWGSGFFIGAFPFEDFTIFACKKINN